MKQPMDKLDPMIQSYMLGAAIRVARIMQMQLLHAIVIKEKERLTGALDYEPTEENWEDYWKWLRERTSKQKAYRTESDSEKLRRHVLGETDVAT
jgi:hypothetical protein